MRGLLQPGAAGDLRRRVLPAVIIIPIVLGSLRLIGQNAELYDTAMGKVASPAEMKALLRENMQEFTRGLAEKMLTYALGRGVESYDRATLRDLVRQTAQQEYRFQALVRGIVQSVPFQQRRAAK